MLVNAIESTNNSSDFGKINMLLNNTQLQEFATYTLQSTEHFKTDKPQLLQQKASSKYNVWQVWCWWTVLFSILFPEMNTLCNYWSLYMSESTYL